MIKVVERPAANQCKRTVEAKRQGYEDFPQGWRHTHALWRLSYL